MSGEKNLKKLLTSLSAQLLPETYVFCTLPNGKYADYAELFPKCMFSEAEGFSLIITQKQAEQNNLDYTGIFRCITLTIHSSLEAVGLTAAVSGKLAENDISANVIAAYHHDHIFVKAEQADLAVKKLNELSEQL